mgnify:CR=1 FL=1
MKQAELILADLLKGMAPAAEFLRASRADFQLSQVEHKGKNDLVSDVDRETEALLVAACRKILPEAGFILEEGDAEGSDQPWRWIIDPLDGTTNFIYGIPHYAVSIALKQNGRLLLGVVYDPMKDEMFAAARGDGALLNNRKLRVNQKTSLSGTLLGTGIAFRKDQSLDLSLDSMKALLPGTAGVRRPGAASLDLAYVAAGRFDGFWEFGLNEWDLAAGALIVQEAGGLVGDPRGGNTHLQTGDIIAANPKVFREMVQRLHPVLSK